MLAGHFLFSKMANQKYQAGHRIILLQTPHFSSQSHYFVLFIAITGCALLCTCLFDSGFNALTGCSDDEKGKILHQLFHTPFFNINVVKDTAGVEMCGALKVRKGGGGAIGSWGWGQGELGVVLYGGRAGWGTGAGGEVKGVWMIGRATHGRHMEVLQYYIQGGRGPERKRKGRWSFTRAKIVLINGGN